jgi:hypothetical protein
MAYDLRATTFWINNFTDSASLYVTDIKEIDSDALRFINTVLMMA